MLEKKRQAKKGRTPFKTCVPAVTAVLPKATSTKPPSLRMRYKDTMQKPLKVHYRKII